MDFSVALSEVTASVMADKGFEIQHLLTGLGVRLNISPFRQGQRQFTPDEVMKPKKLQLFAFT